METYKDTLKPQPHDLNWKDIHSDKLVQFFISMEATQVFKPHSNFKGGDSGPYFLYALLLDG